MVEGQEGVTWTQWVALARTCEAHGIPKLFRSDHYLNLGGVVMMAEGSIVTLGVLAWLVLRLASESELRQRLIEQGLDPRQVKRAVRYGRAKELEV